MTPATIEWDKIGELVWAAPLAAVAVTTAYALLILSVSRAGEARRTGATGTVTAFTALALASVMAFAGIVAAGVIVIVSK